MSPATAVSTPPRSRAVAVTARAKPSAPRAMTPHTGSSSATANALCVLEQRVQLSSSLVPVTRPSVTPRAAASGPSVNGPLSAWRSGGVGTVA